MIVTATVRQLVYTYKPPVSVGISVSPSGPRAADRISRLTGARHARGHDPAPRIARRFASGGRRTAPVACARSANIHDLHLCAMRLRCAPLTYELLWRVAQTLLTRADLLSRMQVRGVITFLLACRQRTSAHQLHKTVTVGCYP